MSRIGKQPIKILEEVAVKITDREVLVKGPKGELTQKIIREIKVEQEDNKIIVSTKNKSRRARMMHGTTRALISNMIKGVKDGWTKELEMVGTGYRAEISGDKLILTVGFSHPVEMEIPKGLTASVEKTNIKIEGIDKELVGKFAAKVRAVRKPEPYKGKGIRYKDEVVRRKPGKAAKGAGAVA